MILRRIIRVAAMPLFVFGLLTAPIVTPTASAAVSPYMKICNASGSSADLWVNPWRLYPPYPLDYHYYGGECSDWIYNGDGLLRVDFRSTTQSFKAGWNGTGYTHPSCTNAPNGSSVFTADPPNAATGYTYTIDLSNKDNCV